MKYEVAENGNTHVKYTEIVLKNSKLYLGLSHHWLFMYLDTKIWIFTFFFSLLDF